MQQANPDQHKFAIPAPMGPKEKVLFVNRMMEIMRPLSDQYVTMHFSWAEQWTAAIWKLANESDFWGEVVDMYDHTDLLRVYKDIKVQHGIALAEAFKYLAKYAVGEYINDRELRES